MAPQNSFKPTITGDPDLDVLLAAQIQRSQKENGLSSYLPSPNVSSVPPSPTNSSVTTTVNPTGIPDITPQKSVDFQSLIAPLQAQAEKLYGGNPVFGHSAFASNHPRLAGLLGNTLIAASEMGSGRTTAENIGIGAREALAPMELARQRAIQQQMFPTQMLGPQLEAALKSSEIGKNLSYSDYLSGARTQQAQATAQNQTAKALSTPISLEQKQQQIDAHEKDFLASDATKRYIADQRAKIEFDNAHDPTGARILGDKLKYMESWQHESDNINLKFDAQLHDYMTRGVVGPDGIPHPASPTDIQNLESARQTALDNHDVEGSATVKELFPGKYKSIYDYRDSVQQDLKNHQQKVASQSIPNGKGQLLDAATAQIILQAAGGDKDKARQLAKKNNWKF